jgi:hypothetical protein
MMKLGLTTSLFCTFAATSALVFAGCSSSGEEGIPEDNAPVDSGSTGVDSGSKADTGTTAAVDSGSDAVDAGSADTGAADASLQDATISDAGSDAALTDATVTADARADAAVDAGVDAARVCTSTNDFQERSCGACGNQSRICRSQGDGGIDWAQWSVCYGERDGGCTPGTEPDGGLACGNRCGTQRAVCQNDCTYAVGSCVVPASAVCDKGTTVWQAGAGCSAAGEGRRHTCLNDCTWGAWSECDVQYPLVDGAAPVVADLVLAGVGQTVSATRTLAASATLPRVPTSFATAVTCPITGSFSSATPYVYTTVGNSTAAPRTVAVWASIAPGGADIDTVIAAYPIATGPTVEADRRNCTGVTNDDCGTNSEGCDTLSGFSGLVGANAITIPPGAVYAIVVQSYFSSDVGSFVLNAKATN